MSEYIAYVGSRTWKHCETLEEANKWLESLGVASLVGGKVFVGNTELVQAKQRLAAAGALLRNILRACAGDTYDEMDVVQQDGSSKRVGWYTISIDADLVERAKVAGECDDKR